MKYIDVHAHVFPDHIVHKVIDTLQDFYGYKWQGLGTPGDLLISMDDAAVGRSIIFSAATKPEQVQSINDYIASLVRAYPERFTGFGTLHPDFPDIPAEMERIRSLGLKGLKFHPDFQQIRIDAPEMNVIYEAAGTMPILFHVGDRRFDYSSPRRVVSLLERFPGINIAAAHMGGYSEWENAWKYLIGRKDVYLDISSTIGLIPAEEVRRMVDAHGADRVLFASDYPSVNQTQAIADVMSLGLDDEALELIFWKNAECWLSGSAAQVPPR